MYKSMVDSSPWSMVDNHCSEIIHTIRFTSSSSSSSSPAPSHSELTHVQSTQREANGETQFHPHARRESEPLQMYTQYLEKRRAWGIVDCGLWISTLRYVCTGASCWWESLHARVDWVHLKLNSAVWRTRSYRIASSNTQACIFTICVQKGPAWGRG